jgi:hypothetical protein
MAAVFLQFANGKVCSDGKYLTNRYNNSVACARSYANALGRIFGDKFAPLILESMVSIVENALCERSSTATKLILNIGPGSSGTRSLFLAMVQLNLTSYHLGFSGANCTIYNRHEFVNLGKYFTRNPSIMEREDVKTAFWGDNPVPAYWWKFYHQYKISNTLMIMTDMNDDSWLKKRRKPHKAKVNWESTVPLAFHPDELAFSDAKEEDHRLLHDLKAELLNSSNVWHVTNDTNRAAFQAYRELIKCSIPHNKLLWMKMSEGEPDQFWNSIVDFIKLPVEEKVLKQLIAAGKPYFGDRSCRIGNFDCKVTRKNNGELKLMPSVCQHS